MSEDYFFITVVFTLSRQCSREALWLCVNPTWHRNLLKVVADKIYVPCGNLLFHLLQLFKGLIWKSFGKDPYLQTEAIKTCSSLEEMSFLIISFKLDLLRLWKFTDWIDFLKKINLNFKRFEHKVKEESIISFVKQSKKQLMKFLVFRPFGLNVNYGMWLWYVGE